MTETPTPVTILPFAVMDIRSPHDPATAKYDLSVHSRQGTVVLQLWSTGRGICGLSILAPGGITITRGHLQALHQELTRSFPDPGRVHPPHATLLTKSLISVRPLLPGQVDRAIEVVRSSLLTLPDLLAQWSTRYSPTVHSPDSTTHLSPKEDHAHG